MTELSVTTGQNNFTMYAYRARPAASVDATPADPVELAVFPVQRIGLRACRDVRVGERLLPVLGQVLPPSAWEKLQHEHSDRRWQWMVRRDGVWMHALNLARFVNSGCGSEERRTEEEHEANANYVKSEEGSVYLECSGAISAGEEVVACGGHVRGDVEEVNDVLAMWLLPADADRGQLIANSRTSTISAWIVCL